MKNPKRQGRYENFSVIILNTLILFIIINLIAAAGISLYRKFGPVGSLIYGDRLLAQAYPDIPKEERSAMLREMWSKTRWEFEPYTQLKNKAYAGKYLNIDPNGYRVVENQCPFPLDAKNYNIFVFGGSTTYGMGVGDFDTIPSRIQYHMNNLAGSSGAGICAYNFGRGFYFSSQERILFESLLLEDQVPDMVLFIDGMNEFYYANKNPENTDKLKILMGGDLIPSILANLPITQGVGYILKGVGYFIPSKGFGKSDSELQEAAERYLSNVKIISAIADEYGIVANFIVQPIPIYKYNLSYHLFLDDKILNRLKWHVDDARGYYMLQVLYDGLDEKENIIWLADIQENKKENLYVDSVHYNREFIDEIALLIAETIQAKGPFNRNSNPIFRQNKMLDTKGTLPIYTSDLLLT